MQLSAGGILSCARNIDNVVACWGAQEAFSGLHNRLAHSVHTSGDRHACVIELDGTLTCTGANDHLDHPPAGRFVQMDMGVEHACGLRVDGSVACWGRDMYGETKPPAR